MVKTESKVNKGEMKKGKKPDAKKSETPSKDKYLLLTNKKRKLDDKENTPEVAKKVKVETGEAKPAKKIFKDKKFAGDAAKMGKNAKFSKEKNGKPGMDIKNGGEEKKTINKKDLREQRKKQKLAGNYDLSVNTKKIWETLRRADTTDETRKKLCTSLFDLTKGRIGQMIFAHDTCRVISSLIKYGNERHREGVFLETKDNLVEMAKSKYARFVVKKMLKHGTKEQVAEIVKAFIGKCTKLIKHSYACQIIESIFNEHASAAQRNQILMEFYDPTFAFLDDKNVKTLSDIFEAQPFNKEKVLTNLKTILSSCINKTLLMFSLVHRVFLEYFKHCDQKQKLEMIEQLSEHLIHVVHTKDGTQVALQCVWHSTAKERKKIIKALKMFVKKIALEEYGHVFLLGIFDCVDDTKFVAKAVLEELFQSVKEVLDNDYGRKVITYLIAPRDSRFFIKDYVKVLADGDNTETSKKEPETRKKELFEYSKSFLKSMLSQEIESLLYNGAVGVLIPELLQKIEKEGDEIVEKIASAFLKVPFDPEEDEKISKLADPTKKTHYISDATSHYIIKQILKNDPKRAEKSLLTLGDAILKHANVVNVRSWIECNRGCFTIVNLFESTNVLNKKKIKIMFEDCMDQLSELGKKLAGARILVQKINEIPN